MGLRADDEGNQPRQVFVSFDDLPAVPNGTADGSGRISAAVPHPPPPAGRWQIRHRLRSARVSAWTLLLSVAAAGALGAAVTDRWQAQRQRLAEESRVSLVVVPHHQNPAFDGRDGNRVRLAGYLIVVNSGPKPIELETVHGGEDGLALQGTLDEANVEAGRSRLVAVTITVDCPVSHSACPIEVVLAVRTADGREHQHSSLIPVGTASLAADAYACRFDP